LALLGPDRSKLTGDPENEKAYVLGLKGVFRDRAEHERYLADGWERMQAVLRLLARLRPQGVHRVLELGANPYVLTTLMKRRFDFDLELANYFGEKLQGEGPFTHAAEIEGRAVEFPFRHFNIEQDAFPYPDRSFDCVLFCEIVEHLLLSADRPMAEIARVLRPGGFVIISTPNAARLPNLYFLARGRSIWDGYSDNGPYGRHNREYTLPEVAALAKRHGCEVVETEVRNVQPLARRFTYLQRLRPDVWYEHIFLVARRRGTTA
jgi:SAM-dependent methyltransferase